MKYSVAVLALLGMVSTSEARHHHHHQYPVSFAQKGEEKKSSNPDAARKSFEAERSAAAATVATQQAFEKKKTADVAQRNSDNVNSTLKQKADVRRQRVDQTMGGVRHDQWVSRSNFNNWAQTSEAYKTPDDSRSSFETHVADAAKTVATQNKFEADKTADVAKRNSKNSADAASLKAKVTAARIDQTRGGADPSRDSRGWSLKNTIASLAQGEEEKKEAKVEEAKVEEAKVEEKKVEEVKVEEKKVEEKKVEEKKEEKKLAEKEGEKKEGEAKEEGKEEKKEEKKSSAGPRKVGNPENSYKEKADSLKEVLQTTKEQRAFEAKSNADVAAAQAKYHQNTEDTKNHVRQHSNVLRSGGLVHTPTNTSMKTYNISYAQEEPKEEKKADAAAVDGPPKQNPENSYKQKADSLKEVLSVTKAQRLRETKTVSDVASAQSKYHQECEDEKNAVRKARKIQRDGGLQQSKSLQHSVSSLAELDTEGMKSTPDQSRKSFETHVSEAAQTVATQKKFESDKTADVAKRNNNNVKDTFSEKARVRAGRVAMMRGGPAKRYGGGHRSLAQKMKKQQQKDGDDEDTDSQSDSSDTDGGNLAQKKQQVQSSSDDSSSSSSDSGN